MKEGEPKVADKGSWFPDGMQGIADIIESGEIIRVSVVYLKSSHENPQSPLCFTDYLLFVRFLIIYFTCFILYFIII